jgi:hypothetical protein
MRITLTLAAALLATSALATEPPSGFAGSLSASGFVSSGQSGSWQVGAMNSTYGGANAFIGNGAREVSTWGGSTSEGFGNSFRGQSAAVGAGGGFARFGRR